MRGHLATVGAGVFVFGITPLGMVLVGAMPSHSSGAAFPFFAAIVVVGLTAVAWIAVSAHRTRGIVEFHEDRIVHYASFNAPQVLSVSWSDVASFDDGAADYVRLLLGRAPGTLFIPTPTDQERVAVLAFLDSRGVRRAG